MARHDVARSIPGPARGLGLPAPPRIGALRGASFPGVQGAEPLAGGLGVSPNSPTSPPRIGGHTRMLDPARMTPGAVPGWLTALLCLALATTGCAAAPAGRTADRAAAPAPT